MSNPEAHRGSAEAKTAELEKAAGERLNTLDRERAAERPPQPDKQESLQEAQREALKAAEISRHTETKDHSQEKAVPRTTGAQRKAAYDDTMHSIQRRMTPTQRTFSKVIHHPTVERVSEVAGNTIARPNSILLGAICAFLAVLGLYALAKRMGFSLSGFETIGAFIVGWIIGLGVDALRTVFSRR